MPTFKIPVEWAMYGTEKVEANTLEEALEKLEKEQDDMPLPDGWYIDGSYRIDYDMAQELNNEEED